MPCPHTSNASISMPGTHGRAVGACPFVWCRDCGAIWLPRQPTFTLAFERHTTVQAAAPFDGVTIEGYWVLPGPGSIIQTFGA